MVIDNQTIEFHLLEPNSVFKYLLAQSATWIYPKEAVEKYGKNINFNPVGTGPYTLNSKESTDFDVNTHIVLRRNPNYYGRDQFGNQLPFLDALEVTFVHDKEREMAKFRKGEYDLIYRLPTEDLIELMDPETQGNPDFQLEEIAEMSTHFISFNLNDPLFQDVNVRKAISYAIDRKRITDYVLNGEADYPGHYGITPEAFNRMLRKSKTNS